MTFTFHGEEIDPASAVRSLEEGQEYRVLYLNEYHNFEFIGRARSSVAHLNVRSARFEIVRWVHENGSWGEGTYPAGYVWGASVSDARSTSPQCLVFPLATTDEPVETVVSTDSNYAGEPGEFVPHNNEMPEPGTVVRGFAENNPSRQVEGLFLRMLDDGGAQVERKRKRLKRGNGTFTSWENYANTGRATVQIEGALVFKAGAAPSAPTLTRTVAIEGARVDRNRAEVGEIISAPTEYDPSVVYRGKVTSVHSYTGPYTIAATEKATLHGGQGAATDGVYTWETIPEQSITVYATFANGIDKQNRAGWKWEFVGPGAPKRTDPAFDPNRATEYTKQKIGDLVVARRATGGNGRDTVSSWLKGTIIKWDTRHGAPIVKVTDKMESNLSEGDEVMVVSEDVYPALADPKSADPEEFKKTLRLYLIGRHKRGDFCQGGLNTMLAAHGIPLYETRRRAKMVITVDYDPNSTDLYQVREGLRRAVSGVTGLSLDERSGEEFEVESDVTAG